MKKYVKQAVGVCMAMLMACLLYTSAEGSGYDSDDTIYSKIWNS